MISVCTKIPLRWLNCWKPCQLECCDHIYILDLYAVVAYFIRKKNSIYVLFMLHYVLSNSKGKYCMNNVIMCMSTLVGCVHN